MKFTNNGRIKMKLRNKKTGEIVDFSKGNYISSKDYGFVIYKDGGRGIEYRSLAELNEEWEDAPAEPLIKDEKIRKAVRAWAEACGYNGACIVEYDKRFNELSGIGHTTVISLGEIDFNLEDRKRYTLAELNEELEDAPAEPLIKDEKICKAVRAWAEANGLDKVYYSADFVRFSDDPDFSISIDFYKYLPNIASERTYTIAELCGNEEE